MPPAIERALRKVRDTLLAEPVSPRVETPADINRHYCRYVAESVAERLDEEVVVLEDGGRGYVHTWLARDGRHYDAECVEGVDDYRELPFFRRHPEAAVGVEPGTADPAAVRNRGSTPLYPGALDRDSPATGRWIDAVTYRRHAVAGVLLGLALLALGTAGEWALGRHLLAAPTGLRALLVDLELLGELLALVAPVVFFVLLPGRWPRAE
ncbi:MAG: hypothetical protein ABEJ92_12195 [Halobacteriales archaeon]